MACGLPVICLDTSGPRDMVTARCGILVPVEHPGQVTEAIGSGLRTLAADSAFYADCSANAQRRIAADYTWERRAESSCSFCCLS
jgi:glycosyltransferase involved in cell wall biosynthesis